MESRSMVARILRAVAVAGCGRKVLTAIAVQAWTFALSQSACTSPVTTEAASDMTTDVFVAADAASPDIASTAPVKRVFVTHATFRGDFGGESFADEQCNLAAWAAGLGGTWRAWLSTSSAAAIDR